MSVEENKAKIRRGFEVGVNERRLDVFEELLSPRYTNYSFPTPVPGVAGLKQVLGIFFTAFPDMQIHLDEVVGEGDRVATRGSIRGTHAGEFMGIPATGKPVTIEYMDIWRLEDGKAIDNWVQMDLLGLMQQLGVIPAQ